MHRIALVLACLACLGGARRAQTTPRRLQEQLNSVDTEFSSQSSADVSAEATHSRAFTELLQALNPTAAHLPVPFLHPAAVTRSQTVRRRANHPVAMVFPADSIANTLVVQGGLNFLQLYQNLITLRILLSWFPQTQGIAILRPVFVASDYYLNLFRGLIPPIGGLDISPIGAFFVLSLLTNSVASLGATGGPLNFENRPLPGSRLIQDLKERFESAQARLNAA